MSELMSEPRNPRVFRPLAHLLRTLGDELISSETVAVIELVKNAYDADATRVLVRFQESLEIGQGQIEIIDNGHGMSLDTIQNAWMEPATRFKTHKRRSQGRNRRVLGEKGIGRFATARLANSLEVITRHVGTDDEIRAFFDWKQFDDEQKYLDQVEITWEQGDPEETRSEGTFQLLEEAGNLTHGTILRMKELRTKWEKQQVEELHIGLARLISPISGQDGLNMDDMFEIHLQLPPPFEDESGKVEPPEVLMSPHYLICGSVDQHGHCNLTLKLKESSSQEVIQDRFNLDQSHSPQCGPFWIELRVWDRDSTSLGEIAREHGSTVGNVRGDLDSAAGISIYRDGFRVLPYGESHNDWLRLDLRRVQNPTMRLSNNQIVGYVLISADDNPDLRDQSNREGLIEGPALNDLRELIKRVIVELEKRRYDARRNNDEFKIEQKGLFVDFDLAAVHDLAKQRYPDDTELLTLVVEKEKDLERRVEEVQEVLARYRRLATLGQLIDTILHDGETPLAKIGNEVYLGLRDIERAGKDYNSLIKKLGRRFRFVETQAEVLSTIFRKIQPFGGRKRGRPETVRLEKIIADAFAVLVSEITQVGAQTQLPDADTWVTVDPAEIQQVIINLLQNSLYWLHHVPRKHRQITVGVQRKGMEEVEIMFSDSGPGVEFEFQEHIFDPYFSTKPDGIGLGLTIAGDIVSEYYEGELALLEGGSLPGATFRITLRKRV